MWTQNKTCYCSIWASVERLNQNVQAQTITEREREERLLSYHYLILIPLKQLQITLVAQICFAKEGLV